MAMWKYTIHNGLLLRQAIYDGDSELTVEALKDCCKELLDKLTKRDKKYYFEDIQDLMCSLEFIDIYDEDSIDCCLMDFYDLCDYIRAFISIV